VISGALGVSIAWEIARIPDKEVRERATREILNPTEGEAPMRKQAALDYIRRQCTRNLRTEAHFPTDDADLVPARFRIATEHTDSPEGTERYFGGDCVSCRFNSATLNETPSRGGPRLGVCCNISCFNAKVEADHARFAAQHNRPDAGKIVVSAERNAEIFDAAGEVDWTSGLVPLHSAPDVGLLKAHAEPVETNWKELAAGKLAQVLIARDPNTGKKVEVIDLETAKAAAEANGHLIFKTSKAARTPHTAAGDEKHKTDTLAAKRQKEINHRTTRNLLSTIAGKASATGHFPPLALVALAEWVCGTVEGAALRQVETRRGFENGTLADEMRESMNAETLHGLIAELILADYYTLSCDDAASILLECYGISLEDACAAAAAEVDTEHNPPAKPLDPNLPADLGGLWRAEKWTKEAFDSSFVFDPTGDCCNPDCIAVTLPTKKAQPLEIKLWCAAHRANVGIIWSGGYSLDGKTFAKVEECHEQHADFTTRFAALAHAAECVSMRLDSEERVSAKTRAAMLTVADQLSAFADVEQAALPPLADDEPEFFPSPDGNPPITHFAVLNQYRISRGNFEPAVDEFTEWEAEEAATDPEIYWTCALAGCAGLNAAQAAAREALAAGAGEITAAGAAAGLVFETDEGGKPRLALRSQPAEVAP
jgi:hypothetical protein